MTQLHKAIIYTSDENGDIYSVERTSVLMWSWTDGEGNKGWLKLNYLDDHGHTTVEFLPVDDIDRVVFKTQCTCQDTVVSEPDDDVEDIDDVIANSDLPDVNY